MALLAALPLFYVYGLDRGAWREITSASLPFDKVWGGGVGVMLGAWAGAVPIPLDWWVFFFFFPFPRGVFCVFFLCLFFFWLFLGVFWEGLLCYFPTTLTCPSPPVFLHGRDREWQKWPITIVTGAYLGYVVGTFAGEYLLRGKRIKFD